MKTKFVFSIIAFSLFSCADKKSRLMIGQPEAVQEFTVNSQRDNIIKGKKGTQILFKANSLMDSLGHPFKGQMKIVLREFYTVQDFINNRLSTQTVDEKLLRSGGMISIQIRSERGYLKVDPTRSYFLLFKSEKGSETPRLFSGNLAKNEIVEWQRIDSTEWIPIIQVTDKIEELSYGKEKATQFIDTVGFFNRNGDTIRSSPRDLDRVSGSEDIYQNNHYLFSTSKLGFINCDFFIDEELYVFTVKMDNPISDVFLVMDSLNVVMYPDSTHEKLNEYFFKIPNGKPITVVAYRKDGDKHWFDIQKTNSDMGQVNPIQKEWAMEKVKEQINALK
jgi:hypothetical protein